MANPRQAIQTAARMYEMQDTAKRLFGERYAEMTAPSVAAIHATQRGLKCEVIPAVMFIQRAAEQNGTPLNEMDVLLLVAAAVGLSETDRLLETIPTAAEQEKTRG